MNRVDLVAYGADLKAMEMAEPNAKPCNVLYVGHSANYKATDTLVKAIPIVAKKASPVRYAIIGFNIEKQNLVRSIDTLSLSESVSIMAPPPDANEIYVS